MLLKVAAGDPRAGLAHKGLQLRGLGHACTEVVVELLMSPGNASRAPCASHHQAGCAADVVKSELHKRVVELLKLFDMLLKLLLVLFKCAVSVTIWTRVISDPGIATAACCSRRAAMQG